MTTPSSNIATSFSGIWIPIVTPFEADGSVDSAGLGALVRTLVAAGVHGIVVGGTTGEPAVLDDTERALVLRTVRDAAGALPLVMGVAGIAPRDVIADARRWQGEVQALLIPPPSYVRPSQQGIVDFYGAIGEAIESPLIVYDIPSRTGVSMTLETMRTLSRLPRIRAVKDCGGDAHKTQSLISDGRLQVLAGDDHNIFTTLCQGGSGAIAASAHLHPERFVALYDAVQRGDLAAARALHHALAPLVHAAFAEPSPGPVKAGLADLGLITPHLRAPMTQPTPQGAQAMREAYAFAAGC